MKKHYTQFGEIKNNNEILASYKINYGLNTEFYLKNDKEEIEGSENLFNDLLTQMDNLFRKQPKVGRVIKELMHVSLAQNGHCHVVHEIMDHGEVLFKKLLDRDVMRHVKNSGFNWDDLYDATKSCKEEYLKTEEVNNRYISKIEHLDDKIESILLSQKAKRLIQKTYSKAYRHLADERTLEIFKIFVEKEIDLSTIHSGFAKKLARYKNVDEANDGLSKFSKELSGWTKELYMEKAKKLGASIIDEGESSLLLKIHSYEQSNLLGSGQWCISYDKNYYMDYRKVDNYMFFNYDFSRDPDDETSMCGLIVDSVGKVTDGYWRDDSYIGTNMADGLDSYRDEMLNEIQEKLPTKYTVKDQQEAKLEIIREIDPEKRNSKLLGYNTLLENIDVLDKALKEGLFSDTLSKKDMDYILEIYKNTSETPIDSDEFIQIKKTKEFLKNIFESSVEVSAGEKKPKQSNDIILEMIKRKDFEMLEIYASNTDSYANYSSMLNCHSFDFNDKEEQENVLKILKIYNDRFNAPPIRSNILEDLYMIKMIEKNDEINDNFFRKVLNLNNNKVPVDMFLKNLNQAIENPSPLAKRAVENRVKILDLALENIDPSKLRGDLAYKNLKEQYPNINKETIKKIEKIVQKEQKKMIAKFS